MGTQQVLLVVIVAIMVAIAISLAVVYFKSQQQDTDINEVINEMNHIAATAQGWYRKPATYAGGDGSFAGFTFKSVGEPDSDDVAKYEVVSASVHLLQLKATGHENFTIAVDVYPDSISPYSVLRW